MKLESHPERVLEDLETAFEAAVLDTRDEAETIAAKHSRTGRFAGSIEASEITRSHDRLEARIGSGLSSARAKERGAFINARNGPYLVFLTSDGWRKVPSVRLNPQPAVTPAGRQFPRFMTARLREVFG